MLTEPQVTVNATKASTEVHPKTMQAIFLKFTKAQLTLGNKGLLFSSGIKKIIDVALFTEP